MSMPEIDRLLSADEANVRTMRTFFADVNDNLPGLLNEASVLYETCCRAFGQGVSASAPALVSPMVAADEGAVARTQTTYIRGLLLGRIGVLYAMAVADFLRMRVTAPFAYIRLQCETLGLIKLMGQDPAIAQAWQSMQTDDDGKRFFQKYQQGLKTVLQTYGLEVAYDRASGIAVHSRFIGIARGFRISEQEDSVRRIQNYTVLAQEFDPAHPHYFVIDLLEALRVQACIFANLHDAAPEITDALLLKTRVPQFVNGVARLDADLKRRLAGFFPGVRE